MYQNPQCTSIEGLIPKGPKDGVSRVFRLGIVVMVLRTSLLFVYLDPYGMVCNG